MFRPDIISHIHAKLNPTGQSIQQGQKKDIFCDRVANETRNPEWHPKLFGSLELHGLCDTGLLDSLYGLLVQNTNLASLAKYSAWLRLNSLFAVGSSSLSSLPIGVTGFEPALRLYKPHRKEGFGLLIGICIQIAYKIYLC